MNKNLNKMVKISLLSVLALIFMFIEVPLPIFPSFLKIEVSDIPAIVGAIIYGPLAGVIIELIKNLLHGVLMTSTGFVGELANFIVGSAFVIPVGLVYNRTNIKFKLLVSSLLGVICMVLVAAIGNYFVFLPLYEKVMGWHLNDFVAMGKAINNSITSVKSLVILSIAPFNVIKGAIVSVVTALIIKPLSSVIEKEKKII